MVSGLLSPAGPPARIIDFILGGVIEPILTGEILDEYRRVLSRPELGLPPLRIQALLEFLSHFTLPLPVSPAGACTDPDDDKFLSAALEGGARWVITGNVRHYPASPYRGVSILTPSEAQRRLPKAANREPK